VSLGAPYGFGQSSNTFVAILAFFGGYSHFSFGICHGAVSALPKAREIIRANDAQGQGSQSGILTIFKNNAISRTALPTRDDITLFFAILAFFGGAVAREDAPSLQYTFLAVTAFPTLIRNHQ
jgi:hypothetical protein